MKNQKTEAKWTALPTLSTWIAAQLPGSRRSACISHWCLPDLLPDSAWPNLYFNTQNKLHLVEMNHGPNLLCISVEKSYLHFLKICEFLLFNLKLLRSQTYKDLCFIGFDYFCLWLNSMRPAFKLDSETHFSVCLLRIRIRRVQNKRILFTFL